MIPKQLSLTRRRSGGLIQVEPKNPCLVSENRNSSFEKPSARLKRRNSFGRRRRRRNRSVSFATRIEDFHDAPEVYCEVETHELWFSCNDFERFMKQSQQEAKTLKLTDEEYVEGLKDVPGVVERLCDNAATDELFEQVLSSVNVKETGIADWCEDTPYRGLEKFTSRKIRSFKRQIRESIFDAVIGDRQGATPDKLSARSQKRSRASRLLARMMALGDELGAKQAYEDDL